MFCKEMYDKLAGWVAHLHGVDLTGQAKMFIHMETVVGSPSQSSQLFVSFKWFAISNVCIH